MEKSKFATIITIILVLALVGGIIYFQNQGFAIQDIPSEKVAKWIGEHSVLYIQAGCSHCVDQENLFGENVKFLTTVDCLEETQKCIDDEIEGTPTWIIDNQKYVGVQSIEKLKELTGYQD